MAQLPLESLFRAFDKHVVNAQFLTHTCGHEGNYHAKKNDVGGTGAVHLHLICRKLREAPCNAGDEQGYPGKPAPQHRVHAYALLHA